MATKNALTAPIPDIILNRKSALKITTSIMLSDRYRGYAVYVNASRSIPAITDSLKGVQRIALWCMKPHKSVKTMGLAGEMIASLLYLHGDGSAGDAISKMAGPYLNNLPLLKGEGGFGTLLKPDKYSSPRYTTVAKPKYLDQLMYSDMDIVPMVPNFDDSTKMPGHFLPLIPLILLNGAWGRGVGYGSDIFPRSFENLTQATILAVEGKPIPEELLQPVFSFNGSDTGKFVDYNVDGNPRWEFRGQINIVNTSTVEIVRLPSVNIDHEEFKVQLDDMEEKGLINDWEDNSTKTIRITVKLPRGAARNWTEEDALKYFKLIKVSSENLTMVGFNGYNLVQYRHDPNDKYPNPVERLIRDWVKWRFTFFVPRYEKLIQDTEERINYLKVLYACFMHELPKVFQTVKNKSDLESHVDGIAKLNGLNCDETITDRIASRASYSWTREAFKKAGDELATEEAELVKYQDLLASPVKQRNVMKREINDLLKIKI